MGRAVGSSTVHPFVQSMRGCTTPFLGRNGGRTPSTFLPRVSPSAGRAADLTSLPAPTAFACLPASPPLSQPPPLLSVAVAL